MPSETATRAALLSVPAFVSLDAAALSLLATRARIVELPAGAHPFVAGQACEAYLVVVSGSVRVQLVAESGREIVLYRVAPGESCVLTTSCLLHHDAYAAEAVCESAVTAIAVPAATFADLLGASRAFRDAVLGAYAERVGDLMLTFEELVFRRLDTRLARTLIERARDGLVGATHQELAVELGSAREVVSRTLKAFERRGLVTLSRGEIRIAARARLEALAAEARTRVT